MRYLIELGVVRSLLEELNCMERYLIELGVVRMRNW